MPGFQLLMKPTDVVFRYDGSLAGFYNCVHTCVYRRELPLDIQSEAEGQPSLFSLRFISTDKEQAIRVRDSIACKISPRALELCENVFLSCMPKKELAMLRFLALGFKWGAGVMSCLTDSAVDLMMKAEQHLLGEAHLFVGFVRFADWEGKLIAAIRPKNFVLPLLAPHFLDRYAEESLLIYDQTHRVALVCERGRAELTSLEGEWPELSQAERFYQELWKQFYHTIGIRSRENPKCRMSHMPNRYWGNMVEFQSPLGDEERKKLCSAWEKNDKKEKIPLAAVISCENSG